jgi:hypothetical protein
MVGDATRDFGTCAVAYENTPADLDQPRVLGRYWLPLDCSWHDQECNVWA